jgi:DNA-binding NarL/FixJ family response regulator
VLSCSTREEARRAALLRDRAGDVVAVALLGDGSATGYREVLETGVDSAVARTASVERIVEVVEAALHHRTVLPTEVARGLACRQPDRAVDDVQAGWLRALAHGATVEELADSAGYSERAMYRQLRRLYDALGADNRTDALLQALRRGLID